MKNNIFKDLEEKISHYQFKAEKKEFGEILEIKDGTVKAAGLTNVAYGEIVEFENKEKGYVIDLTDEFVGIIVLGDYKNLKPRGLVFRTNVNLSVPVSDKLLGRVINPLGLPVDGGEVVKPDKFYPLEKIAPGVIYRRPVNTPLQTGIKVIDALIPIGRGQRELIIGDRGTGKTTIAIDTILNQKKENVICIYCAIGQKQSKIASVIDLLEKHQALDYTIVVAASASDPVSLQYLAPYSACAIGEYGLIGKFL
jgi:F-type H+-transporting ATPase subunit alpha